MPDHAERLFAVQAARRRVVLAAKHAGQAREEAARLLGLREEERDQLQVGEPEDEEVATVDDARYPPTRS
jgi:hypothetical protein